MNIGFIGFGEAAYCISIGLREEGISGIKAFDAIANHSTMGILVKDRAREAEVLLLDEVYQVVDQVDLLIVAVPSSFTLEISRNIAGKLRPGQLYIDVSASTPVAKQKIWDSIKESGALFVDAAMLGSLPLERHKVPITASGTGATVFRDLMAPYGMRITCLDAPAGAASAIKLVRSIYMKGIAALMFETLQAAAAYSIHAELVESISTSMDGIPFKEHLERLVIGTAIHAKRRADELKGSIQMLDECNLDAAMTIASKHKHEWLEEFHFNEIYAATKPSGYQEIIQRLK
ncbi:MAG: DUF1932 domain-containing protein [Spirochaetota bacterium]